MRFILLIAFCFLLTTAKGQKFLLLDRKLQNISKAVDTVTRQNLSDGLFPIFRNDLDSLILLTEKFYNLKEDGLNRKFYYSEDFKCENFSFVIENIKRTYGDGYDINLITLNILGSSTLKLSDSREKLPANQKNIRDFLSYLKMQKKKLLNQ